MNRSTSVFIRIALALAGATASGAGTTSSTRIFTNPSGAYFYVDGQLFTDSATFFWPQGSKHTLKVDLLQQNTRVKERYSFTGWTDSSGVLSSPATQQVITADPAITSYEANFVAQYAVTLSFFACPASNAAPCNSPGKVLVNNVPYAANADVYVDAGSNVVLQAVPNPGYVFNGWLPGTVNTGQSYLNSFTLNGPVIVYPQFVLAAKITIASIPPGLQILADHVETFSPVALDWGVGTSHTVGAVTPQIDVHGKLWVFSSWSDGGAATHAYTAQGAGTQTTLTVNYVAGELVTLLTNPPGLTLIADGLAGQSPYNLSWGAGTSHMVSVPQQQVDAQGNGWSFRSWSNGGAAVQVVALPAAGVANGLRLTANFDPSNQTTGQLTIQSSVPGVAVVVDGVACSTPCTLQRTIGSYVHVSAGSLQLGDDTRLEFSGWADGAAADRTITVTASPQTFTANYQSYYRLLCTADAASAVTWHSTPASPDGFYPAQTPVAVSIDIAPDYQFQGWSGDARGNNPDVTVKMDGPKSIRAHLTRAGNGITAIVNAAGMTPVDAVAPGSIISIYGPNLAPATKAGPASPLAQALGGVTVTSGDLVLPLLFVSPGQINAQLPSALPEGDQTLTVHAGGQPDLTGTVTVERNAPGLFYQQVAGKAYLIALHQDGSLVSPKSPARRGEQVTALGTGFGPYSPQPPDGFAAPNSTAYKLVDRAELVFADQVIEPEFAGAAAGRVGITAIRFRIADPLPTSSVIELKARVNGQESNTVLLSLE